MGSISLRKFIRWLPHEASEPTSTIVVTSPGRRFVDIRVIRPEGITGPWPTKQEKITLDQLDWAIAGTSSSRPISGEITHGQWHHWIDSRTTDTENLSDEGDNYPQPDGTTLEKGRMVNPATGKETEYEELWCDVQPLPAESTQARSVVLQLEKGSDVKGSVVLLGQYCQGFLRKGSELTAERWEWTESDGWSCIVTMGHDILPCSMVLEGSEFACGDLVNVGGDSWRAVEVSGYE